ncbi:protein phosphatase 2C domain-containing protein [Vibrio metschnikovii]|nr:protein phosphatase 2C domain-containing protein [Vibrio metschnikovii]
MNTNNRLSRFVQQIQRYLLAAFRSRPLQATLQAKTYLVITAEENPMPSNNHVQTKQKSQPVTDNNDLISDANIQKKVPAPAEQKASPRSTLALPKKTEPKALENLIKEQQPKPEPKTQPLPKPKPEIKQEPVLPNQQWQSCFEAIAGLAHRDANPPLPCQDSAIALNSPRPTIILADGAGSSAVSEIGSQAVTLGLARLLNTLERQVEQLLDKPMEAESQHQQDARNFSLLLVKHARGILDDLATQHRRPQQDFRCTLLLAVQGKSHLLWLKIGDGALITETLLQTSEGQLTPQLKTLGQVGKGEFANTTTFIDANLQPKEVQSGLCDSQWITGFAAMSDGGADRLVRHDGTQISGQISNWLHQLRQSQLKRRSLSLMFSSDIFTRGTTGDDISLALCASGLSDSTVFTNQDSDE